MPPYRKRKPLREIRRLDDPFGPLFLAQAEASPDSVAWHFGCTRPPTARTIDTAHDESKLENNWGYINEVIRFLNACGGAIAFVLGGARLLSGKTVFCAANWGKADQKATRNPNKKRVKGFAKS